MMMKWMSPMRVTMQELDAKLSKIVERAREAPVAVNRYGSPWVWIVSHQAWVQADNLRALVPQNHPLVALHDLVEDALRYERDLLADLQRQHGGTVGAATLFKCLMLQIIYSLEDGEKVHESLTYNMLFRWFVGFEKFADALPDRAAFTRELNAVGTDARVNRGLLHALSTWASAVPGAAAPGARPHEAVG
jgi:transposase